MMPTLSAARVHVDTIFASYPGTVAPGTSVLSPSLLAGKMYEAWILAIVLEDLRTVEHFRPRLVGATMPFLKSGPGPINTAYPHFELVSTSRSSRRLPSLEVWTDVEFCTLSSAHTRPHNPRPHTAHRHELDIVVVESGGGKYPTPPEIRIAVECKYRRRFTKDMARAALGVRRELGLLKGGSLSTGFLSWPTPSVPVSPPSVLMVYSKDLGATVYNLSGGYFGIMYEHE